MKKLALAALLMLSAVPARAAVIVSLTGTDDNTGATVAFSFTIDPAKLPANTGGAGQAIYNTAMAQTVTGGANDFLAANVDGQTLPRPTAVNTPSIDSTAQNSVIELDTSFAANTTAEDNWFILVGASQALRITTAYGGVALPDLTDPNAGIGFFITHFDYQGQLIQPDRSGTITSVTYTDTNATVPGGPGGGGPGSGGPTPSVVPEPAGWATMVAGFGLAGVAMRRRRAQSALASA